MRLLVDESGSDKLSSYATSFFLSLNGNTFSSFLLKSEASKVEVRE